LEWLQQRADEHRSRADPNISDVGHRRSERYALHARARDLHEPIAEQIDEKNLPAAEHDHAAVRVDGAGIFHRDSE